MGGGGSGAAGVGLRRKAPGGSGANSGPETGWPKVGGNRLGIDDSGGDGGAPFGCGSLTPGSAWPGP